MLWAPRKTQAAFDFADKIIGSWPIDLTTMKKRSAIKSDIFTNQYHQQTIDKLGDPLVKIETCIDFVHLAAEIDHVAPRPVSKKGGRPPYPAYCPRMRTDMGCD